MAFPTGRSTEISYYDSSENSFHELAHVLDYMLGSPSTNLASSYQLLVQHDLINLDYLTIASTKALSTVRTPCNNGNGYTGPFQNLTDPDTGLPFCSNPVGGVWQIEPRYAGMSNSKILQQVGAATDTNFAYLFVTTNRPKWFELFADEFYWSALSATGNPPPYPEPWNQSVRLFMQPNPAFFTCSEGTLKSEFTGTAVTPPASCTNTIPSWYVPFS